MLQKALFSVIFKIDNVVFREEYELAYRTEEERTKNSTLYQQAIYAASKDLEVRQFYI